MKASTHPKYETITVTCSCGNTFETRSTLGHDLTIEVCSQCHPFYTGRQKLIDTGGRVQRFRDRYTKNKEVKQTAAEETATKETAKKEASAKSSAPKKAATKASTASKGKESKSVKKVSKPKE